MINSSLLQTHGVGQRRIQTADRADDVFCQLTFRERQFFEPGRHIIICLQRFFQLRITVGSKKHGPVTVKTRRRTVSAALYPDFSPQIFVTQDSFQHLHCAVELIAKFVKITAGSNILYLAGCHDPFIFSRRL